MASDRSSLTFRMSVVARFRQRISELECKFEVGVGIPVPDNSSSYATVFSASVLPAGVDAPPGLAALPQVQSHGHVQGPPPPPVPIGINADDSEDDGPLHITYVREDCAAAVQDGSCGSSRRSLFFIVVYFIILF